MHTILKKIVTAAMCSVMALSASPMPVKAEEDRTTAVYRLYNSNTGEHLFTTSSSERENLICGGWSDEGIGFYVPAEGDDVFRLYNPGTGEHHYTLDSNEKETLQSRGWRFEGTAFHSDRQKRLAVYRACNLHAVANNHNYTVSSAEQNQLVSIGWRDEGTSWYASANGDANAKLPGFYHYTLPYYSQLDPRWRYERFGAYTFGATGCVPTSLAMVIQGIKGGILTPYVVGDWAHKNSNYNNRNPGSSDVVVAAAATFWQLHCENIQSLDQLVSALRHGKPVVIVLDGGNAFMSSTVAHCVVMHGYNSRGQTYISDPYYSYNCKWWGADYIWSIRTQQAYLLDNSPYYCYALYE